MSFKKRPSVKELSGKVAAALVALRENRFMIVAIKHLAMSMDYVGAETEEELKQKLMELLSELKSEDLEGSYAGTRPPQKSYELTIKDSELFAFCWESEILESKAYLKFCIKKNPNGIETLCFIDCHESKNHS